MAGHFHLLAQMKVTKAKGLTRSGSNASARGFGWRRAVQLATASVHNEERRRWLFVTDAGQCHFALNVVNRTFDAKRAGQIVFGPFALVTFIWASK
jgi:hypothetical protein